MIKTDVVLNTNGRGLWSNVKTAVRVKRLELVDLQLDDKDKPYFGELRVYFDRRTWNTDEHGLIYTDGQFLKELRKHLNSIELKGSDVDYSEQGMQGDDYVSLDVGSKFIKSWEKLMPIKAAQYL